MDAVLIEQIQRAIDREPLDYQPYEDLMTILGSECVETAPTAEMYKLVLSLRPLLVEGIKKSAVPEKFYKLYRENLLFCAPADFDSYLLYLEIDRLPKDRFYQPRRKTMKVLVDAIQDLVDDKLDELFLSMPPRVGKTTILMFLITWLIGRDPNMSNLYCAYSDIITNAMFGGILEILRDPITYKWREVFKGSAIGSTNAALETINIDNKYRHYPSITCRSLYGTLNGACDCSGFLISDDLIGSIEEVMNKERMRNTWMKVQNNMIPRAKEKAKFLWCGTRWSVADPAGQRMDLLENDASFRGRRYKIINLPALNENDESNFDYEYGVGFSTTHYHRIRASFERDNDMASWYAQFMGEPIEREGTLFTPQDFRYFNGVLPDEDPDRIFMPVDPAWGGGDFVAAPICLQYGDNVYIPAVVYTDGDKTISQPMIAKAIEEWGVRACQVEANKMTESYADAIQMLLKERGIKINLTTKAAPTNKSKELRIYDHAPDIREHFIFIENGKRTKEYQQFMNNVFAFRLIGKNDHDDAPDSLAMAAEMLSHVPQKAMIFKRTW